jgi:hypothetical protein
MALPRPCRGVERQAALLARFSSVVELAKVMTEVNRAEALPKLFDKSRQEAKQVAAEILPADVVPVRTVATVARGQFNG